MLRKLRAGVTHLGVIGAFLYWADRALARLGIGVRIFRYHLMAQPVPDGPLLPPRRGRAIAVRRLEPGDPALPETNLTAATLAHRFGQQAVCLAAFQRDRLAGFLWLVFGPYDEDEVRCRFVPVPEGRAAWDFGIHVLPEFRGGFVFARLWDAANDHMRSRGVKWSLSRISAFNPGSMAAHEQLRAVRLGAATYLRLGLAQVMVSRLRPYIHLSWSAASVPEIRLRAPD